MKPKSLFAARLSALFFVLLAACSMKAYGRRVLLNNLNLELDDTHHTAQILSASSSISGDVTIYGAIKYDNTVYRITSIANKAFSRCSQLSSITISDSITSMGYQVFEECTNLVSARLPQSLTSIQHHTFSGCSNLQEVNIPDSAKTIDGYAFNGCTNLTHVTIPQAVNTIEKQAFRGCGRLAAVTLPGSITLIDDYAFADCPQLQEFAFPDSARVVHEGTFSGCTNLSRISLPKSLTSIKNRAFSRCSALTQIDLPQSLRTIEEFAFFGCSRLARISIPKAVTIIDENTFLGCSGLKDVELHSDITTISEHAFGGCTQLTLVDLPDSLRFLAGFDGCTGLTTITVPQGVRTIGLAAFENCTGLTSIRIPSTLTDIEERAFSGCTALTSITLPKSVVNLGDYAFRGCMGLDSVVSLRAKPGNVGEQPFSPGTLEGATLYVPIGATAAYRSADGFQFKNIVEINPADTVDVAAIQPGSTTFGRRDGKGAIELGLTGNRPITGVQFNLALPAGFMVAVDEDGEPVAEVTARSAQHSVRINKTGDGHYGVVLFSLANKPFGGDSGAVVRIPLVAEDGLKIGNYSYEVTDIVCSYMQNGKAHGIDAAGARGTLTMAPAAGDANGDGRVNVTDVVEVTNYIVGAPSRAFNATAADYNGDGRVDVVDVADIVNTIVTGASVSNSVPVVKSLATPRAEGDALWADDVASIEPGERKEVNVYLRNAGDNLSAYQFDLQLPEGIEMARDEAGAYMARINSARHAASHALAVGKRQGAGNTYGFLCMSTSNKHLKQHEGLLLTITLADTKESVAANGTLRAELKNILFSTANPGEVAQEVAMPDAAFIINERPVGVRAVKAGRTSADATYTLDGVKLPAGSKPAKGLYIRNGQKVLVR